MPTPIPLVRPVSAIVHHLSTIRARSREVGAALREDDSDAAWARLAALEATEAAIAAELDATLRRLTGVGAADLGEVLA